MTVECPCCGWEGDGWVDGPRPRCACPSCGSLERHRLLALYLRAETDVPTRPTRLLHVAPEPAVRRALAASPFLQFVGLDRRRFAGVNVRADLARLPFPDGAFDAAICSHVLEHVADDHAALRELARVLAPDGLAVLLFPVDWRGGPTEPSIARTRHIIAFAVGVDP